MHYLHPLWIVSDKSIPNHVNRYLDSQTAFRPDNPFPPVDTQLMHSSAKKMLELTTQSRFLINKLVDSPNFAYELMDAAQQSNQNKVNELIKSTGITSKVKTKFSPTGIHLEFENAEMPGRCCKLQMALQW